MSEIAPTSIIIGEYIEKGSYYFSKAGNKVYIYKRTESLVNGKYAYTFYGRIVKTVPGHEILLNRTHTFDARGRWLKLPGGIHDLTRKGYPG